MGDMQKFTNVTQASWNYIPTALQVFDEVSIDWASMLAVFIFKGSN